jgi:hypothetical protein
VSPFSRNHLSYGFEFFECAGLELLECAGLELLGCAGLELLGCAGLELEEFARLDVELLFEVGVVIAGTIVAGSGVTARQTHLPLGTKCGSDWPEIVGTYWYICR